MLSSPAETSDEEQEVHSQEQVSAARLMPLNQRGHGMSEFFQFCMLYLFSFHASLVYFSINSSPGKEWLRVITEMLVSMNHPHQNEASILRPTALAYGGGGARGPWPLPRFSLVP